MKWFLFLPIAIVSVLFISLPAFSAKQVDYVNEVKPLLKERCFRCHGPIQQKGELRLDTKKSLLKGSRSGPVIVPGEADESLLLKVVTAEEGRPRMPKEGEPLTAEEVELLRRWITEGAEAPANEVAAETESHWAFQNPVRPEVPRPKNAKWVRNPVDAFLAVAHEREGLRPQREAPKHILLRRVYLDLIGLPPTTEELEAFLNDESPDAYEKVVDDLLKSPHYGERWGRHWMDIWRYSDWYGYKNQLRNSARHIWRWRDWIVESLNEDKSYDRMVVEMLAADELDPADAETLRATGFLARNYYKFNRDTWLDDTIEHTSKAFLGVTLNCARCHDHMYDPIAQKEYYQFRAFFEPHKIRTWRISGQPDIEKNGIPIAYDAKADVATYLYERGNTKMPDKENPLEPAVPASLNDVPLEIDKVELPVKAYYPGIRPYVQEETLAAARKEVVAKRSALEKARRELNTAKQQLMALKEQKNEESQSTSAKGQAETADSDKEKRPVVLSDNFSQARPQLWERSSGRWEYKNERLVQSEVVSKRSSLVTKEGIPRDFSAVFRLKITGGQKWKSVGLSFDVDDAGNAETVYLSAHAGGPKVQISRQRNGQSSYPTEGRKSLPIRVGTEHELRVDVQDRLMNVFVDERLELVHRLSEERRGGRLSVWTFDATAEFLQLDVFSLGENVQLAEKAEGDSTKGITTVTVAKSSLKVAELGVKASEKQLAAAETHQRAVQARIAADKARYEQQDVSEEKARQLAVAANQAERREKLAEAEAKLAQTKRDVEKIQKTLKQNDLSKKEKKKKQKELKKAKSQLAAGRKELKAAQANLEKPESKKYSPLTKVYPSTSTGRRLALARWIAHEENPLTARVAVNHIWMRHFGKPLVSSVFDFGMNGAKPTHPKLLDWLAVEFMEQGWSMKHLHRLIVTSTAYRMHSSKAGATEANLKKDPDNRFLWRMNSRRMEAEIVRDSVLAVSDRLNPKRGGPELDAEKGETTFRRSIYYRHAPEKRMQFLKQFDAPSVNECYRRDETTVPQQALALANSRLAREASRILAGKINEEVGSDAEAEVEKEFIRSAFFGLLCRYPKPEELSACREFLSNQSRKLADEDELKNFTSGPKLSVPPAEDPYLRARENLVHVLLNHSEFVTIR